MSVSTPMLVEITEEQLKTTEGVAKLSIMGSQYLRDVLENKSERLSMPRKLVAVLQLTLEAVGQGDSLKDGVIHVLQEEIASSKGET